MPAKHTYVFSVDSRRFPSLPKHYDEWKLKGSLSNTVNTSVEMFVANNLQTKIEQFNAQQAFDNQTTMEKLDAINSKWTKSLLDRYDEKDLRAARKMMERNLAFVNSYLKPANSIVRVR